MYTKTVYTWLITPATTNSTSSIVAVSPLCTGKLTNYRPTEKEKRLPVRYNVLK